MPSSPTPGHYTQVDVLSTVREIEVLQEKLQATEDEDEHRALEEDITGKILWFYWRGICSEVDQILAEVKNFTREGLSTRMISDVPTHRDFGDIAELIKGSRRMDLDDDMAHLQRIMLDAGAGISRHQLWLASRPAGLAGLSGLPEGNPILGAQENVSGTSPEAPSTSTALDANKRRFRLSLRRFNL
ncbi:hypothetical protein BKA82DRAFT_3123493 [Pisolithus tinctorius]|nr:hypothetical protein BKA82DRAFT_3123493 [Pisolithus tinctorius]